jgi:hypothetical protein
MTAPAPQAMPAPTDGVSDGLIVDGCFATSAIAGSDLAARGSPRRGAAVGDRRRALRRPQVEALEAVTERD